MSTNGLLQTDDEPTEGERSREELRTQLEVLRDENQQLRESYTRAKQTQYRRTAVGLGVLGSLAVVGGILVSSASDVLFALGGIGLFGGLLTYYLTPEQSVSADVGRDVYASLADNEAAIADELGLSARRCYVPTPTAESGVRLFVPQHDTGTLPDSKLLTQTVVVPDDDRIRGLALEPSGQRLFDAFDDALTGSLADTPGGIAEQLTDAIVEQFELARSVTPEVDIASKRVTVAVADTVYGRVDRFDHPVASVLAVGLARGLDEPVSMEVTAATDDRSDYLVTCRWGEDTDNS